MYIAYSALRTTNPGKRKSPDQQLIQRYQAYQAACEKYSTELTHIQKYIPGWLPPFELKA